MKRRVRKLLSLLLSVLMITCFTGAGMSAYAGSVERDASRELTLPLDGSPAVLQKGVSYTFPTLASRLISGLKIQISTSNSSVVSVKDNVITANASGKCTLTITLPDGRTLKKDIVVPFPEVTIKLNKTNLTMGQGESTKLSAILSSCGEKVTFSSSDKDVVTVDSQGKLTAKRTGSSVITAALRNGKKASCTVTVKRAPRTLTFADNKLSIGLGESSSVECKVNAGSASCTMTYTSSDPKTVEVNSTTGKLTTHKTGKAVITAKTSNGKKAQCEVSVQKAPTTVTLNKTNIVLKKGQSTVLTATLPKGSASGKITFTPSNDKIVKVDSSGIIKAIKTGVAYITVTTYNGRSASCRVQVK